MDVYPRTGLKFADLLEKTIYFLRLRLPYNAAEGSLSDQRGLKTSANHANSGDEQVGSSFVRHQIIERKKVNHAHFRTETEGNSADYVYQVCDTPSDTL